MIHDYNHRGHPSSPSLSYLRHKLKSSICCFSGSIHAYNHEPLESDSSLRSRTPRKTNEPPMDLCVKIRRAGRRRHSQSADFSYDPSSYALNFEDEARIDVEEMPLKNFTSRLPATPPKMNKFSDEGPLSLRLNIVGCR